MRRSRGPIVVFGILLFSFLVIILAFSPPSRASPAPEPAPSTKARLKLPPPEEIKGFFTAAKDFKSGVDQGLDIANRFSTNVRGCLARGENETRCRAIAAYCELQDQLISAAYPGWVSDWKIFGAFKIDCGDGQCFQCCNIPGQGCHTSFIGFPVINCNSNYGPGTHAAGITEIVNPDEVEPGDACLFIPQTCDHIPACNYRAGVDLEALQQSLLDGADHPLTWQRSVENRARSFAENVQNKWDEFQQVYSTVREVAGTTGIATEVSGLTIQADDSREKTLTDLGNLITGRGCKDWRTNLTSVYPLDWTAEPFRVTDEMDQISEAASQVNGVHQMGLFRVLSSVPNIYDRLASVDSRVWTQSAKDEYLAQVGDPDQELLKHMSPETLAILKEIPVIQDYRLLAVPLPDETVNARRFNGCQLGQPPIVEVTGFSHAGQLGVELAVTVKDPEQNDSVNPALIFWGDGTITSEEFLHSQQAFSLTHTYAQGGQYLVYVLVENDAGLRGLGAVVVDTASSNLTSQANPSPTAAKIVLEDLTVFADAITPQEIGTFFELELVDETDTTRLGGMSLYLETVSGEAVVYGDLVAHNTEARALQKLVINPHSIGEIAGFFNEIYFTVPRLTVEVYTTEDDGFATHSVDLTPQMLKVYPVGSDTPLPNNELNLDGEGVAQCGGGLANRELPSRDDDGLGRNET